MQPITLTPIWVIRTPFTTFEGAPIQAVAATDVLGEIELDPAFAAGLGDIEGFSHLILVYYLHRMGAPTLEVTPFLDSQPRGVFATRSPKRPNAPGLSTVRLLSVAGTKLQIADVDMLDGTPPLDIKPYVPHFDDCPDAQIGWFASQIHRVGQVRSSAQPGVLPGDDC
ncbi:MAG: tRNA (N6-threonylcarbamoyladenosine(37)-N6)-methyltransferase TrmO [Chloroflexaceae bacterium]